MQRDGAQQADLKALWAGAYEAWRHVPGHPEKVVCLIPEEAALAQGGPPLDAALPAAVHNNVLFGLTSWNPMGEDAPMEQNLASYPALLADLRALQPAHIWQSYGFDSSGYRENGFTVAFPADRAAAAREATVEVAKKYGQGAVYELTPLPGDSSRILRRTVPALVPDVDADVVMASTASVIIAIAIAIRIVAIIVLTRILTITPTIVIIIPPIFTITIITLTTTITTIPGTTTTIIIPTIFAITIITLTTTITTILGTTTTSTTTIIIPTIFAITIITLTTTITTILGTTTTSTTTIIIPTFAIIITTTTTTIPILIITSASTTLLASGQSK
eukprot:jgi/Tetstr1/446602/TSEL_034126.t1